MDDIVNLLSVDIDKDIDIILEKIDNPDDSRSDAMKYIDVMYHNRNDKNIDSSISRDDRRKIEEIYVSHILLNNSQQGGSLKVPTCNDNSQQPNLSSYIPTTLN